MKNVISRKNASDAFTALVEGMSKASPDDNIAKIIEHADDVFPEGVHSAFSARVADFLNDPSASNAADVQWLLLAVMIKHDIIKVDLELRYEQLVDRLKREDKLTSS